MRVLHVIPSIAERYGGPSLAIGKMVRYQRSQGIHADIAGTDTCDDKQLSIEDKAPGIYLFKSMLGEYKYSLALTRWLKKFLPSYDLVHIHSIFCYSTVCASFIALASGKPYVVRTIGQLYPWALNNRSRLIKKLYLTLFEKRTLEKAAALHFTTPLEKENLGVDLRHNRNFVLPLGIDPPEELPSDKLQELFPELIGKKVLLFLGRLHPKKGLELLIASVSHLLSMHGWLLVIAGEGDKDYLEKLKGLTHQHESEHTVRFCGQVDGERKQALLQLSKIFILPSYQENFGLAVAEAMSSGIPVLVSNQVGICDEVERTGAGLIFDLKKDQIVKAVERLMKDPELRKKQGGNGYLLTQESYHWEKITRKQAEIYRKILRREELHY